MSNSMPVTRNVFQAFRCRSSRHVAKTSHDSTAELGKVSKADSDHVLDAHRPRSTKRGRCEEAITDVRTLTAIEHNLGIGTAHTAVSEAPAEESPVEREESSSHSPGALQTVSSVIASSPASASTEAFVLSAASLRARGRQKIPLENAKGLPERLGDMPLRLIVGGNNPSDHAWSTGHYYSHPANWMWRILKKTGIAPAWVKGAQDDERMVTEAGVGFLDVGYGHPGTILSEFSSETFQSWAPAFYARLKAHMDRASKNAGCVCGKCGAPAVVGFAGKRQWMELLNVGRRGRDKYTKLDHGVQHMRPQGWPFPASTEVWVLPSTSGAAPMATAERVGPWRELSDRVRQIEWPRKAQCLPKD